MRSGVAGLLVGAAWWSGLGGRIVERLAEHTSFALGALAGPGPVSRSTARASGSA